MSGLGSESLGSELTEPQSVGAGGVHYEDDEILSFGNTDASPDVSFTWNTAQTVDGLYLGLATAQNTFIIAESGDIAYDFAHGAQTHPTVYLQSANQSATEFSSWNASKVTFGLGTVVVGTEYSVGRNNDATNRLQYNIPTGTFHEFSINDATILLFGASGVFLTVPLYSLSGSNYGQVRVLSTGTIIDYNQADANIPLIIDNVHASATGDIAEFRSASSAKLSIDRNGGVIFDGAGVAVAGNYEIRRNSDATNRLQINVPTGGLIEFSVNDVTVGGVDVNGFNGVLGGTTPAAGAFTTISATGNITFTPATVTTLQVTDQGAGNNTAGRDWILNGSDGGSLTTGAGGGSLQFVAGNAGGSDNNNGGSFDVTPGTGTGSGKPGTFQVHQAGGTPGTDTLRISHNGSAAIFENGDVGGFSFIQASATYATITSTGLNLPTTGSAINFFAGDVTLTHSAGALAFAGGVYTFDDSVTMSGEVIQDGTTTTSGAGAVAITGSIHEVTTTGTGNALTLANGAEGQLLTVVYVAEGAGTDTAILTPSNLAGTPTTITFNAIGDAVRLQFTAGTWFIIGANGVTIG